MNSVISNNLLYKPDFILEYSEDELEQLSNELSAEDEKLFEEILKLEEQNKGDSNFMKELLEAAKKGVMQYLDAMTDTGDTFNKIKDPNVVSKLNNIELDKRNRPADVESNENWQTRTMSEAKINPFDKNVSENTLGMSEVGKAKFEKYKEAYSQRLKTSSITSNGEGNIIKTSDPKQNYESLSGLRNYRFGPIVQMPDIATITEGYEKAVSEGRVVSTSNYIREQNFKAFDNELMKKFGFSSRAEAKRWRESNHLTIHETSDGMYLVPTDVHDSSSHKGYCSKLSDILKGKEGAAEAMKQYIIEEKVAFVKHEAQVRGVRAIKGVGLSAIKDVLKCTIVVMCEETYSEFQIKSEDKFIDRMLRIFKNCWEKVKAKCKNIIDNIWSNIKGSLLSEFLTALNDFFFGTFKNIFKIIRQMLGSIKSAWKIIINKNTSWGERFFEASKILSAGVVGIIGFSLNELIEKGLTSIGIPFASFIAECLSGLFAGIMSAIVIMLFDKLKKQFTTQSRAVQILQLESRSLCINCAQVQISSLKLDFKLQETYDFIGQIFISIKDIYQHIQDGKNTSSVLLVETTIQNSEQKQRAEKLGALIERFGNDDNF